MAAETLNEHMVNKFTFKTLVEASVKSGEMDQGTADYFYGLFRDSAEMAFLKRVSRDTVEYGHYGAGQPTQLGYDAQQLLKS